MSGLNGDSPRILQNFIGGEYVDSIQTPCKYIPVTTPHTGEVIAQCPISTAKDVEKAVEAAKEAYKSWRYYHIFYIIFVKLISHFVSLYYSARTVKDRVQTLFRFHNLLHTHIDELADLIVLEHGKNKAEVYKDISFLDHNYFN